PCASTTAEGAVAILGGCPGGRDSRAMVESAASRSPCSVRRGAPVSSRFSSRARDAFSRARSRRRTSVRKASSYAFPSNAPFPRAIATMSYVPGSSYFARRNTSRRRRLIRFRSCDFPRRRLTTSPSRECSRSLRIQTKRTASVDKPRPCLKTRRKSVAVWSRSKGRSLWSMRRFYREAIARASGALRAFDAFTRRVREGKRLAFSRLALIPRAAPRLGERVTRRESKMHDRVDDVVLEALAPTQEAELDREKETADLAAVARDQIRARADR